MKKLCVKATVFALFVVCLSSGTSASASFTPAPSELINTTDDYLAQIDPEQLRNQEDLFAFNNWVSEYTATTAADNYITSRNDAYARTKTVLWYGDEGSFGAIVTEGKRRNIKVVSEVSPYSYSTFELLLATL